MRLRNFSKLIKKLMISQIGLIRPVVLHKCIVTKLKHSSRSTNLMKKEFKDFKKELICITTMRNIFTIKSRRSKET